MSGPIMGFDSYLMISRSKLARLSERISTMATKFRLSSLIPAGLIVEGSDESNGVIIVSARAVADRRSCPLCNRMSDRVHSCYVRIIADLPCAGTKVQLRLSARRFICEIHPAVAGTPSKGLESLLFRSAAVGPLGLIPSYIISGWLWEGACSCQTLDDPT